MYTLCEGPWKVVDNRVREATSGAMAPCKDPQGQRYRRMLSNLDWSHLLRPCLQLLILAKLQGACQGKTFETTVR